MLWKQELLREALTCWIRSTLKSQNITPTEFWREAGFEPTKEIEKGQGKGWRRAADEGRLWNIPDICLIAAYFHRKPSWILAQAESYYKDHEEIIKKILLKRSEEQTEKEAMRKENSKAG